jgi:RecA-family ATPase
VRSKTLNELLSTRFPAQRFLIEPQVLSAGGIMVIYGRAGTLKSWLSIDLAFALTGGTAWAQVHKTNKASTLIVQSEVTESLYQMRIAKYCQNFNGTRPDNLFFDNDIVLKLDNFIGLRTLIENMEDRKPRVIILDCLYKLLSGSVSNELDLKKFTENIDYVRSKWGTAFIIVHHPRKSKSEETDEGIEEMLSSSILGDWLDTILRVSGVPAGIEQPSVIDLTFQKVRHAEFEVPGIRLRFNRETARFSIA